MAVEFGSKPHGALGFPYNAGPSLAAGSALPPLPEIPNTNTRLPLRAAYVLRGSCLIAKSSSQHGGLP